MRWVYMAVIVLGFIAAVSAAVLVAGLRQTDGPGNRQPEEAQKITIVTASRQLKAMSVVEGKAVELSTIDKEARPEGAMTAPEQVIGKVLAVKVNKGQAFTRNCFVTEGSGPQMAAILGEGKRAVSISLPAHSGLRGLLYPGCLVDVLLCTEADIPGEKRKKNLVSLPLLQGVQVLAVGNQTLFTKNGTGEDEPNSSSRRRGRLIVTLMVSPDQAQALQLGQDQGELSLTMRNPFDDMQIDSNPLALRDVTDGIADLKTSDMPGFALHRTTPTLPDETQPAGSQRSRAQWEITVIRGEQTETEFFNRSASGEERRAVKQQKYDPTETYESSDTNASREEKRK